MRRALARELDRAFEVVQAGSYADAIGQLERTRAIAAVVSDLQMAGPEDGLLLLERAHEIAPGAVRVLVSGALDRVAGKVPTGIITIEKPWRAGEIVAAIERALRASLDK